MRSSRSLTLPGLGLLVGIGLLTYAVVALVIGFFFLLCVWLPWQIIKAFAEAAKPTKDLPK